MVANTDRHFQGGKVVTLLVPTTCAPGRDGPKIAPTRLLGVEKSRENGRKINELRNSDSAQPLNLSVPHEKAARRRLASIARASRHGSRFGTTSPSTSFPTSHSSPNTAFAISSQS